MAKTVLLGHYGYDRIVGNPMRELEPTGSFRNGLDLE